ncbi:hypothetical protein GCM10022243_31550 [Saccharothrix violaceirubra]|uniref:Guanylate cyclase domain-containing protein n=1 Tax=Saccharothrix violaceirubra TaxID=413306 RepID=A0A7W7T7P3_9PSEU|nr:hypothetical protein [Saccharothrix violaceirubra]MBB4966780.1 hypothetical protein [Saccharothrix violaceirubra]
MAGTGRHAVHRTMVLVDVEGYSAAARTLPHQLDTRAGMYAVLAEALAAAGVPMRACWQGDAGDGVVVLVPPEYPKGPLVEVLPEALARAVRGHNSTSPDAARARLRLAVHAGEVAFDEHGATSPAMVAAFRLLDAAPVREALIGSPGVLAMIVSGLVFDEVVRNSMTLDPATFRPVEVSVKAFHELAWISLPDQPYPPDPTVLTTPSPAPETPEAAPRHRAPDSAPHCGTCESDGVGPRGVRIAGDVHGSGPGITIGAATGDHVTIGTPPPPPRESGEPGRPR